MKNAKDIDKFNLSLEKCTKDHFNNVDESVFENLLVNTALCLPLNYSLNLFDN